MVVVVVVVNVAWRVHIINVYLAGSVAAAADEDVVFMLMTIIIMIITPATITHLNCVVVGHLCMFAY